MIDWRTDDDVDWESLESLDQAVLPAPSSNRVPSGRRQLTFLFAILIVLFGLGFAVFWQLQRSSQETAVQLKTELLHLHQTAWQTAVSGDIDLYSLFLNPIDRRWFLTQRILIRENLFAHRAPLGIWLDETAVSDASFSDTSTVWLSADLQTARIKTPLPYLVSDQAGGFKSITLVQTAVYQQTNNRWQQRPAETIPEFWGRTIINRGGDHITLIYPERDKVLGRRILHDLDQNISQLCASSALDCAPNLHVRLYLSPENDSMLHLARDVRELETETFNAAANQHVFELVLPTPTLVGLPIDDAGYDALRQGYAAWVGFTLINNSTPTPIAYESIMAILADVGVSPPPVAGFIAAPLASAPAIPLPQQPIHLLCREAAQPPKIWTYHPATDRWELNTTLSPDTLIATFNLGPPNPLTPIRMPPPEALLSAVPASIRPLSLTITLTVPTPQSTDLIYLAIDERESGAIYLFRQSNELLFIDKITRFAGDMEAMIGQNGRILTLITSHPAQSVITLYDLQQEEASFYTLKGLPNGRYGWSLEGDWFFISKDRGLTLLAPAFNFKTVIYHHHAGCTHGSWSQLGH